ncbi:Ig-like domain-containing protein [Pseudoalteromonas luteoviolacea]|uniref:Uncharacterized protein n=1 Tax=Pseudoalteromonas luteoviolacea H33 TaxID=1365251 RepID=A0A167D5I3_9GAMM|nr:Ig-like domain-containing protein [Pseudoalteromonas luteoviolacea]KZN48436.1 hypothetical protein N476_21430 [Pseudoalteromonas luteoviolacea H33]KZN73297.1 hypothetical protein N477_23530 [Pseudoalteromonas luteoviolacea H33-S]MBQ4876596.1 cadherin-like domain-containing protein [Pseudoalteromonas luteoviolacea]MBQ4905227.1 cadherin-like domain-containing protein [Pseudoalteromonas luteoviolacea]
MNGIKSYGLSILLLALTGCGGGSETPQGSNRPNQPPEETNHSPVANKDSVTIQTNEVITFDPLANDSDPDGDPITLIDVVVDTGNVTTIIENNALIITPEQNYVGDFSLTYTISDDKNATATGIIDGQVQQTRDEYLVALKQRVDTFASETLDTLNDNNIACLSDDTPEYCDLVEVKFSDGEFDQSKADPKQTILILEDEGVHFSSTLRYRSRIKSLFYVDEQGFYQQASSQSFDPTYLVPKIVHDTLKQVDQFTDNSGKASFIPAAWFIDEFHQALYKSYESPDVKHGLRPLHYLLEHNPHAELIVGPYPKLYSSRYDLYCNPTEANIKLLKSHTQQIAEQFKQTVLQDLDVEYINFSAGTTIQRTLVDDWGKNCEGPKPSDEVLARLYDTIRPFYDAMFNTEGVMGFQAGTTNMTEYNNALDIDKSFENRSLIAYFESLNSQLPVNGQLHGIAPTPRSQFTNNDRQWIDLFINSGVIDERPFPYNDTPVMLTSQFGLSYLPMIGPQPSWFSPVALSWAIHIKETQFPDKALDNSVIKEIQNIMTPKLCTYTNWEISRYDGRCKMQDPMLHRQHQLVGLGYIK